MMKALKRVAFLGVSLHAWLTFLKLNFIVPKSGGGKKG